MGAKSGRKNALLLAAAANSPPFYRNPPHVSLHRISRLISLDPLELSKFSTLTDTNTAVAPPRGALQSVLDRFTRVVLATILRSDIGFSRSVRRLTFRGVAEFINSSRGT